MRISRGDGAKGGLLTLVDRAPAPSSEDWGGPDAEAAGDFDAFYRREFPRLVVLARVLAGPAVADDVAQEAMLVAYRKWDEVELLASPAGWVRSVCLHKAVSVVRRRSVEQRVLRTIGSFRSDRGAPVEEDERFWSEVRKLPLRQAQVVALHYALDLGVVEIAATLGCAEGTVKSHLSRGRAALAKAWRVEEVEPA
jgi:RNA polymerase sigma-70 factor (ECF subfamily)